MEERGGRQFAKELTLFFLSRFGGSNTKLLQAATGLPPKLLHLLLAELMSERAITLNGVIFSVRRF